MSCSRWSACSRKPCSSKDPINDAINQNLEQLGAKTSTFPKSSSMCCNLPKPRDKCSTVATNSVCAANSACAATSACTATSACAATSTVSGSGSTGACSRSIPPMRCTSGTCSVKPKPSSCGSSNVCVVVPEKNTSICGQIRAQNPCRRNVCSRPAQYTCSRTVQQGTGNSSCFSTQQEGSSKDNLTIGTYVHIMAIQDKFRPAGQNSIQKIAAVVMYVSSDGQYQLGTRKGIIGKLFSRDEMEVRDNPRFTTKDVPNTKINMYEASQMAF